MKWSVIWSPFTQEHCPFLISLVPLLRSQKSKHLQWKIVKINREFQHPKDVMVALNQEFRGLPECSLKWLQVAQLEDCQLNRRFLFEPVLEVVFTTMTGSAQEVCCISLFVCLREYNQIVYLFVYLFTWTQPEWMLQLKDTPRTQYILDKCTLTHPGNADIPDPMTAHRASTRIQIKTRSRRRHSRKTKTEIVNIVESDDELSDDWSMIDWLESRRWLHL